MISKYATIMEDTSFAILEKYLADSWRMSATFRKFPEVRHTGKYVIRLLEKSKVTELI